MRSVLSMRKTGHASATAEFIMRLMSHSLAEMILGDWISHLFQFSGSVQSIFQLDSFHGSVLRVCFSWISKSELRARESIGFRRPLKTRGNSPKELKAKLVSCGGASVVKNHPAKMTIKVSGTHGFHLFHAAKTAGKNNDSNSLILFIS